MDVRDCLRLSPVVPVLTIPEVDDAVPLARALVKTPSSDVLNQVLFFGGVAYVF